MDKRFGFDDDGGLRASPSILDTPGYRRQLEAAGKVGKMTSERKETTQETAARLAMDKPIPEGVVLLRDALRIAFRYGETYWQQADSESYAENRRSDDTMAKFKSWADETAEHLTAAQHPTPRPQGEVAELRAEVEEARDGWHMANGTADLAMKHRDVAEARAERLAEALRAEAALLRAWARESRDGGWSTHQYDPMLRRAAELEALAGEPQ